MRRRRPKFFYLCLFLPPPKAPQFCKHFFLAEMPPKAAVSQMDAKGPEGGAPTVGEENAAEGGCFATLVLSG